MKHLKKFEELDYSTYMNASKEVTSMGQSKKGEEFRKHAKEMEMKKINTMSFDILVGDVRTFNDAKYISTDIIREVGAKGFIVNFESSGGNTHRVFTTLNSDGSVVWRDYNKFSNRKSVNEFQSLLQMISSFQPDMIKMLDEMNLKPENLKVVQRTFYI